MAKRQKKAEEDHSGDWLNTYADMVTLLLTFFVLLFACSSLDETKLQYIYQAFQSRGKFVNNFVDDLDPTATDTGGITDITNANGGDGEMPESFDQLYVFLAEYVQENNLAESISIEQGAAHLTISFDDKVFFDGDSAVLKEEGRRVLSDISPFLKAMQAAIQRCTISGHTAGGVISAVNDWSLSAGRAVSVVNYLEFRGTLPSEKFRAVGCGNTQPIASNDTAEGRAKNRRVEMTILKNDLDLTDKEVLMDILKHDFGLGGMITDPEGPNKPDDDPELLPDGSVDKIIDFIKDKFNGDEMYETEVVGPFEVDGSEFIVSTEESGGDDGSAEGGEASE